MLRKVFDLAADFGLNPSQHSALVKELIPSLEDAKKKYENYFIRRQAMNPGAVGESIFMNSSAFDAAWGEAVWAGNGGGQDIRNPLHHLLSYNPVIVPPGTYMVTLPPEFSLGKYDFSGNGWTEAGKTAHNTCIALWHEKWQGDPNEVHGFTSGPWGKVGTSYYMEGMILRNVRVDGRFHARKSDQVNCTGFRIWQMGTGSFVQGLRADNLRSGFEFFNPTPADVSALTAMNNVEAGILHTGGWGSSLKVSMLETDNCAAAYEQREGYGYAPGGTFNLFIKGEDGVKQESISPRRGQMAAILRGQFEGDLQVQFTAKEIYVDSLVLVDPIVGANQPQKSTLRLHGKTNVESGQGYRTLIQQAHNTLTGGGGYWSIADKRAFDVCWSSEAGGVAATPFDRLTKAPSTLTKRRHFVPKGGAFVDNSPTPEFKLVLGGGATTTPPVDPTPAEAKWVEGPWGEWSPCANGQQVRVRQVYSSIPNVVPEGDKPKEIDERVCEQPPPTQGSVMLSRSDLDIERDSYTEELPQPVTFNKIIMRDVLFKDTPNYQKLAVETVGSNGLRLMPTGLFRTNAGSNATSSVGQVIPGINYPEVELKFSKPITINRLFAAVGTGSALRIKAKSLEFILG